MTVETRNKPGNFVFANRRYVVEYTSSLGVHRTHSIPQKEFVEINGCEVYYRWARRDIMNRAGVLNITCYNDEGGGEDEGVCEAAIAEFKKGIKAEDVTDAYLERLKSE